MALTLGLIGLLPFAFAYTLLFSLTTVGVELLSFATERPWNGEFYVNPLVLVGLVAARFAAQYLLGERVALRELDETMTGLPDRDLRDVDGGLKVLYVVPVDSAQFGNDRDLTSRDLFPSTHPDARDSGTSHAPVPGPLAVRR